jgi:ribosome-binding protein aMBF1 (putative translation factor)
MEECSICLVPETRAVLFEVVSPKGIVKICGRCYGKENLPLVNKGIFSEPREQSVHDRMMKISGVMKRAVESGAVKASHDASLKKIAEISTVHDLVDFDTDPRAKEGFIYNFHWMMMRGRRSRHVTQEQLASAIKEPERMVRMIENVPKNKNIITKIEAYLGVSLRKRKDAADSQKYPKIVQDGDEGVADAGKSGEEESKSLKLDDEGYVIIKDSENITTADLLGAQRKRRED